MIVAQEDIAFQAWKDRVRDNPNTVVALIASSDGRILGIFSNYETMLAWQKEHSPTLASLDTISCPYVIDVPDWGNILGNKVN
jgi:hypothetical protein